MNLKHAAARETLMIALPPHVVSQPDEGATARSAVKRSSGDTCCFYYRTPVLHLRPDSCSTQARTIKAKWSEGQASGQRSSRCQLEARGRQTFWLPTRCGQLAPALKRAALELAAGVRRPTRQNRAADVLELRSPHQPGRNASLLAEALYTSECAEMVFVFVVTPRHALDACQSTRWGTLEGKAGEKDPRHIYNI